MQSNHASAVNDARHFHTPVDQLSRGSPGRLNDMSPVPQLPDSVGHNNVMSSNTNSKVQDPNNSAVSEKTYQSIGADASRRPAQIPPRASSRQAPSIPTTLRIDDHFDQQTSRNGSWSSTGDSYETNATSVGSPEVWNNSYKRRTLELLVEDFDLAAPLEDGNRLESLEIVSDLLFSREHLKAVFADPASLLKFTSFLSAHRPQSIATLIYFLDATKALKAIEFANAVSKGLGSLVDQGLTAITTKTINSELEQKAEKAFCLIAENDLPAYTTNLYLQVVKSTMARPSAGSLSPTSQDGPDGFAEVFCLTDPSRPDNPILFASEAFHQMTQYSMNYIIGRNCRFLQGPKTNPTSVKRLGDAVKAGRSHCEVILNYRRDGSPFMNLLMHAPLRDHLGKIRYYMGAQIDVSNIVDDSYELESLQQVIMQRNHQNSLSLAGADDEGKLDEFQEFVETLDMQELKAVRAWEDRMLQEYSESPERPQPRRPGMLPRDRSYELVRGSQISNGDANALLELYNHYLLIRPYPSLRILFASPSLSKSGILQSPIMDKIGGSSRVRDELDLALSEGREVTAKVKWMVGADKEGQNRWIHFTPLVGNKGQIGVWMAILEEEDAQNVGRPRQFNSRRGGIRASSPIPEEPSDFEEEEELAAPSVPRSKIGHRAQISWSGPEVAPELRSPILNWYHESRGSSLSEFTMDRTIADADEYESLEERLRKKRLRDAARLLEQPDIPTLKTYKSLAPDNFLNEQGM